LRVKDKKEGAGRNTWPMVTTPRSPVMTGTILKGWTGKKKGEKKRGDVSFGPAEVGVAIDYL